MNSNIAAIRLPVLVVLGRVTRELGDIYKLEPGTVVDLQRSASDPVEVMVNGRMIASGRLVSSNGKYAVEIAAKTELGRDA